MTPELSRDEINKLLVSISNKRARIVVEHILEHGFITTEELEKQYGYNHPPRAARDVREAGIPLETYRTKASDGRSIAAYRFGDLSEIRKGRLQGRITFSKKFKEDLYVSQEGKCSVCSGRFEARYLQVDHKVPYEVSGDSPGTELDPQDFMLLCGSCNRAKSWSCEHCANWQHSKLSPVCLRCYWASPDSYVHIALQEIRRVDILWGEEEIQSYERLKAIAQQDKSPIPEYVKKIIAKHLEE